MVAWCRGGEGKYQTHHRRVVGEKEGKRSGVMGLILAERIIKHYYHNGPVIQPACTQRSQPSHVCSTKRREEGGRAQINRRRKSKRNSGEGVRRRQTAKQANRIRRRE